MGWRRFARVHCRILDGGSNSRVELIQKVSRHQGDFVWRRVIIRRRGVFTGIGRKWGSGDRSWGRGLWWRSFLGFPLEPGVFRWRWCGFEYHSGGLGTIFLLCALLIRSAVVWRVMPTVWQWCWNVAVVSSRLLFGGRRQFVARSTTSLCRWVDVRVVRMSICQRWTVGGTNFLLDHHSIGESLPNSGELVVVQLLISGGRHIRSGPADHIWVRDCRHGFVGLPNSFSSHPLAALWHCPRQSENFQKVVGSYQLLESWGMKSPPKPTPFQGTVGLSETSKMESQQRF